MISIVIPVYNVENYLEACLDSVLAQTYREWEVILVNDGSTDRSGEICQKYCERDSRFRFFEQENRGVSAARNLGMTYCRGEYLYFMDADDTILSNTLANTHEIAQKTEADLICFQFQRIEKPEDIQPIFCPGAYEVFSGDHVLRLFLMEQRVGISMCNKLVNRELVQTMTFEEGRASNEDKYFLHEILCATNTVVITEDAYYCYWLREKSATTKPFSERWFDGYYFAQKIYSQICDKRSELEKEARYQLLSTCYFLIRHMDQLRVADQFAQEYRSMFRCIQKLKILDVLRFTSTKRGLGIFLIKYIPFVYRLLRQKV